MCTGNAHATLGGIGEETWLMVPAMPRMDEQPAAQTLTPSTRPIERSVVAAVALRRDRVDRSDGRRRRVAPAVALSAPTRSGAIQLGRGSRP